ncbi:hypothetical protein BVX94_02265 [bacterium B17]|nr:hypothetical protein BVX94_02265 [bacterium B17]
MVRFDKSMDRDNVLQEDAKKEIKRAISKVKKKIKSEVLEMNDGCELRKDVESATSKMYDNAIRILPPVMRIEKHQCWKCGSRSLVRGSEKEYGQVFFWCNDCGRTWHQHL